MKQIIHDFDLREITTWVAANNCWDLEDGFWELVFVTESATCSLPQLFENQSKGTLPAHFVRITGARLVKILDPSCSLTDRPNVVEIRAKQVVSLPIKGELFNGVDRDQSGSESSGKSPGEDSSSS